MKGTLTQERLKELLDYNPESGHFYWKVKSNHFIKIGAQAGGINQKGYVIVGIEGARCYAHRVAWLFTYGKFPTAQVDHIDGDKSNNSITNLRLCTNAENHKNQGIRKTNTSGFKGVSWDSKNESWFAQTTLINRHIFLGYYESPEEASIAYNTFAKANHGQFYKDTTKEGDALEH
jgi:hypothetical protein